MIRNSSIYDIILQWLLIRLFPLLRTFNFKMSHFAAQRIFPYELSILKVFRNLFIT